MTCKVNDLNLSYDSGDRLRNTIGRLTGWNVNKAYALAGIMKSDAFKNYLAKHLTQDDILKNTSVDLSSIAEHDYINIKQNKFGSLLNAYYLDHYHSVDNTKTAKAMGRLNGFTSSTAKKLAKDHTADIIIDEYINELNKPEQNRGSIANRVVDRVRKKINDEFLTRATSFAHKLVDGSGYSDEAKAYAQKLLDIVSKIETAETEAADEKIIAEGYQLNLRNMASQGIKKSEQAHYNELKKQFAEAKSRYDAKAKATAQLKFDRYVIAQNLVNLYTTAKDAQQRDTLRNYANLVSQINGDADAWFFQVYNTKKMTALTKEFNKLDEIGEYLEQDEENDDSVQSNYNNETVDETTKTWEDSLFKNFNQSISTRMRMILSRVPKMTNPYDISTDAQSIDTNNELGVKTYYDPTYLTVQMYSYADFTDVNSMIRSIENQAMNAKSLYGLTDLTNRMKNDRNFANYVYVNFAKPVVNKVMATINNVSSEGGIVFDYSNPSAFAVTKLVFDMMNKLRATYNNNYDAEDINILNDALAKITNKRNPKVNEGIQQFTSVVRKYFPNMDSSLFNNIVDKDNVQHENVRNLIRNMRNIIEAVKKLKDGINAEYKRINDEFNAAKSEYNRIADEINKGKRNPNDLPPYPVKRGFDLSKRELTSEMNQAIFNIANIISKYNDSRARLNTANAEGNTASDVIKNCFITRFFNQIMAESVDDSNAGLKALGNYLMQGTEEGKENQYSNNPILFGLKDENGQIIVPGMFTQTGRGGFIINNNAKDILRYALFDGVKNSNNPSLSAVYQSMSKQDFFITQYVAFSNSLIDRSADGNTTDIRGSKGVKGAVYPMRIGSDAPKIFMIRAPRYNEQQLKYSFYNHFLNEMNMFTTALSNLFVKGNDDEYIMRRDLKGLIGRAYFDEGTAANIRKQGGTDFLKALVKDGKLVGNMFKFNRLFKTRGYDFGAEVERMLSLYGDSRTALFISDGRGGLKLNNEYINNPNSPIRAIKTESGNDRFVFEPSAEMKQAILNNMITRWMNEFMNDANVEIADFVTALKNQKVPHNENTIRNFLLNTANMNMNYDDLFEGDFKYYNKPRDFLKRTKETQAGGESYENTNLTNDLNGIQEIQWNGSPAVIQLSQTKNALPSAYSVPTFNGKEVVDKPMVARNGWRAVTIYNTVKAIDQVDRLVKSLTELFIKEGRTSEKAKARAEKIAYGYGYNSIDRSGDVTKINDAQSYITLEEFIRRKDADGTLDQYQDLIAQLLDPNVSADDINLDEINARIQVQKNFYYDKVFDPETGQFIPRQIKNAEFVLIPKLLPKDSELRKVYEWMRKNDIGQLNTAETDKAAKKNVFTIWDEQTGAFDPNFESKFDNSYIGNYYYQYLYKQQDVPQHMEDENNKLGSQISKKVLDNVSTASPEVQQWANEYQDAYTENIRDSYNSFLESMGWEFDAESGRIVNRDYKTVDQDGNPLSSADIESNRTTLNLSVFFTRAREEASRLGMDSNFIEYLIPNEFGRSRMPLDMNNVRQKLESVAQALFNRAISRQTLPGWHAAQITGIGYSRRLNWNPETGIMEVYLPRWSKLIPKGRNEEENAAILKQIEEEGLDIHLGYRIPTEGKQSVAVLKVVGFTNDAFGSTIVVPDAWVTQTGSDFDVDSVYGIAYEMYSITDKKTGRVTVHKVPFEEGEVSDENLYTQYVNEHLDNRVRRTDLGEEIDSRAKELRDSLRAINRDKRNQSKAFDKLDTERNETYEILPIWAKRIIINANRETNRIAKQIGTVVNIKTTYPQIVSEINNYLESHKIEGEELNNVNHYVELLNGLSEIMQTQDELVSSSTGEQENFSNDVQNLVNQAKQEYLNKVEKAAKEAGLMSFEEFSKQPHIKKLSRRARNNYILDRMIKIMNDPSSREEQYSRSQFENLAGANELINDLSGESGDLISPYNPLTQLRYFDDVMSGARLKALSVNWDTFISRCNRMHAELSEDAAIEVVIPVEGKSAADSDISYNIEDIQAAYGDDFYIPVEGNNQQQAIDRSELKNAVPVHSDYAYGNEKRLNVTAPDTVTAIINGERTATTRYAKDGNIAELSKLKVGDVVRFYNKYGKSAYVRITKPLTKLPVGTSPEIWSQKEGWSVEHFNRIVRPEIEQGTAYQMEYEYINPDNPDASSADNTPVISSKPYRIARINNQDIWMKESRIRAIQPLAQEAIDDGELIYIDWRTFSPFNYKKNYGDVIRKVTDEINGFYHDYFGEYPKFVKGKIGITEGLFNLLKAVSPDEFFAIMQNIEKIAQFIGDKKKGKIINKKAITDYIKNNPETTDEELAEVIKNTNKRGYDIADATTHNISKTLIDDKSFQKKYPKTYAAALAIYNYEHNIKPVEEEQQPKTRILRARKLGWSNTNRNIVGDYVTNSTSETTAHHLDAVKEGSIPNVNDYTFNVYKFLTGIGLDHEYSIGLMRQPIISRLVANYNLTNSVYFGGKNNPINMTILDIAIQLGSTRRGNRGMIPITKDDTVTQAIEALKNNSEFANAFERVFGINIQDMTNNEIYNLKVRLDKRLLFNRIKRAAAEHNQMSSDINQIAFDFGMLLLFKHTKKVTDVLNNMMQVANVDKLGAKPSIRETRMIRNSINQLRMEGTLTVGGKNFIDALFPIDANGTVDVDASANKPVAAAYAYATLPSIAVGQQIFAMERESGDRQNPDFVEAENIVQERIGHKFTEQEHKEYKRYAMNYLYNHITKLFTPLTVDERGRIVAYDNNEDSNTATNYWDEERSRVVGYGVVDEGNFTCENVNHPTREELAKYLKLTPAQKIIFIQRNFPDGQGITNYIKVSLLNNWDKINRGITRQYLSYDDQVDSIEDLYDFFERSFNNNNPLIKLAAVDLIKYAFIAEGYNFRSGYITKVIPNDVLYTDSEQGGLDIIDGVDGIFTKLNELPSMLTSQEFIETYVRSHSNIYQPISLGDITYRTNQDTGEDVPNPSIAQRFRNFTRGDGLVVISGVLEDDNTQRLINKLNLKNKVGQYIKVDFPIDANRRDVRLYRVEGRNQTGNVFKDYFLIPMNLLEPNEAYEISYNEHYNRFNTANYYDNVVDTLADDMESWRTQKDDVTYAAAYANSRTPAQRETIGTYIPSTGGVQEVIDSPYFLQSAALSADEHIAGGAKMLLNPIQDILLDRVMKGNFRGMYVMCNNPRIANLIERGTYITQTVSTRDGSFTHDFTIAHVKPFNKMLIRVFNNGIKTDNERDMTSYAMQQFERFGTVPTNPMTHYYFISPVKQDERQQDNILKAATDEIVSDDSADVASQTDALARRGRDIDKVSASIIKQVTYDARKNSSKMAQQFIRDMNRRGISRNYRGSLIEHRKDIYTAAARYYRSAANSIINALNSFEIVDRETGEATTYDMSSEAMYDALAKNDQYFAEVAGIILDAVTFGNRISDIMQLDLSIEDKATKDAIDSIRNSINSVRNNTKVSMAMNNLINIYFKKYSTNPLITDGLMNIRDQYGDIDTVVKLISDPAELNNSEVQVILKEVYSMFSKAEMFDTKRNVEEWKKELAEIDEMSESLEMGNVIDNERGMIRQEFNEKFLEDKAKIIKELNEAKQHRFESVDAFETYLRAQYKRDKFMYDHTEQPIMDEYYKEELANRFEAMQRGGKAYFEYRMLSAQLYDMKNNSGIEETDEETTNRKQRIKNRMRDLKSLTDISGAEKRPADKAAAQAINDFITKRREINKKYFNTQEYDGFQEDYQRYSSFIKNFDKQNPYMSLEEKLQNIEYKEAYNWVKNNGSLVFTDAAGDKLAKAFKTLVGRTTSMSKMTLAKIRKVEGAIDETGNINPLALTDEQIAQIKQSEESELGIKYANGDGEMILIKDIPSDVPLRFKKKKAVKYKQDPTKANAIGRINEILGKTVDKNTGRIDVATLFNNEYITDAEREELVKYYNILYATTKNDYDPSTEDYRYNESAYNAAMTYYNDHLKNTKQGKQFLNIFCHFDSRTGKLTYNKFIYGYKVPLDEYIDTERTEAFRFIQDNVQYVPTDYYYQAMHKATEEGRYDEWYKANHIYNAFVHKWQPLSIWTKMEAKPDSELAKSVEYIPSFDNVERSIKPEYINKKYSEFGHNYKKGDSKYDSTIKLNAKEQAFRDLLQRTLNKYATTYQGKRFVGQGYLPRERSAQVNGRWALGQLASLLGFSWHSGRDSDSFNETVDYSHDREADMKMLQLLKDKGTKEYLHLPNRADFNSDKDYQEELERVREENRKIAEENRKIDSAILNRNWREVMEDFVYNATIFNSRQAAKPYLYLLLEDLANNDAYMIKGIWNKRLVKDLDTSTQDDPQYRRTKQANTREVIHNLARRLLFDQYHENSKFRSFANFMQNMTSAKYMVFNLYGGIANVTTGKTNIAIEEWANEYFGFSEFHAAERMYLGHTMSIVASAFTDKAPNLVTALIKEFHVVDFDQILQFGATAGDIDARLRKVRDFMYSFQSMGEHYMQNSVLFAMLKSNRLYTDDKGIRRIGDFKDYTNSVERQAMRDILAGNQDLLMNYEAYLNSIRAYDIQERMDISTGRKDINRSFLYSLRDSRDPNMQAIYKKIAEKYQKHRDELMKTAKADFLKNKTVESLYEYRDGKAVIKQEEYEDFKKYANNPIGDLEHLVGAFREKVKSVNKKIHGVYDKDGAALIESRWWGSLVMQYHKHLPMGIWKHWRSKGYYNEFRGSMERGMYQTAWDFVKTEFTNFKTRRGNLQENGTGVALASIQVTIESLLNTFVNVQFNWHNLNNFERANMRRLLGEVGAVLSACLVVALLYGLSDDDDVNDDRFKASLLYLADRLYTETTMYSPYGLLSEFKTNWSQPLASLAGINDAIKATQLITGYLFDPEFNPEYESGRYAGENKFDVLLKRNTLGLRSLDRILTIDKNNSYYKLDKQSFGINVAKNFGDSLAGR